MPTRCIERFLFLLATVKHSTKAVTDADWKSDIHTTREKGGGNSEMEKGKIGLMLE